MNPPAQRIRALALAGVLLAAAACSSSGSGSAGSSSSTTGSSSSSSAAAGSSSSSSSSGGATSATLTVVGGGHDGNGPLTNGRLVCFHSSDGHMEFEFQGTPRLQFTIDGVTDGSSPIPDQFKIDSGQVTVPAGQPKLKGTRLEFSSTEGVYPTAGTLTISGSGASGTIDATSTASEQSTSPTPITFKAVWQGCPQED